MSMLMKLLKQNAFAVTLSEFDALRKTAEQSLSLVRKDGVDEIWRFLDGDDVSLLYVVRP